MSLRKLFRLTAHLLVTTHICAALIGLKMMQSGYFVKKENAYKDADALSEPQRATLRDQIESVLHQNTARDIIVGDVHCDMRFVSFIGDAGMMKKWAALNVKRIYLELPPEDQKRFDAVALGLSSSLDDPDASYSIGREAGREYNRCLVTLIQNAAKYGIRVYASDTSNDGVTALAVLHGVAVAMEGEGLKFLGLERFADAYVRELGARPFNWIRLDDRKTAAFVERHSGLSGRNLIFRGAAHVLTGGDRALRTCLPNSVSFVFIDPAGYDKIRSLDDLTAEFRDLGQPYKKADYTIDLSALRVTRVASPRVAEMAPP
jgi:hypothetical protein